MQFLTRYVSKAPRNKGITLIEVLVSIGLLATLMVTTLSIRTRHVRQIRVAREIEQATLALDRQIAIWFEDEEGIPVDESGILDRENGLTWKTTVLPLASSNSGWQAVKIRVAAVSVDSEEVVVAVDLLDSPPEEESGP